MRIFKLDDTKRGMVTQSGIFDGKRLIGMRQTAMRPVITLADLSALINSSNPDDAWERIVGNSTVCRLSR